MSHLMSRPFYVDSTPTHSYVKYLDQYQQAAHPYEDLGPGEGGLTRMLRIPGLR